MRVWLVTNGAGLRVVAVGDITRGILTASLTALAFAALVLCPVVMFIGWVMEEMDW